MLTVSQANRVWNNMVRAEVRSMYYAELAANYTRRKQILAAIVLFLTSGAAVSAGAKLPDYVPVVLSVIAAGITAYTIAFGLDRLVASLTKLHYSWNELYSAYDHLWNHWFDEDAERTLEGLLRRAREASELGTEVPYNERLIDKWQDRVYEQYATGAV